MSTYRARWRTDATGYVARYAGQWASLLYPTREALEEVVRAAPNGDQLEIVEVTHAP